MLAADACVEAGLSVAIPSRQAQAQLTGLLPAAAAVGGPIDTTAAVSADAFAAALAAAAGDAGVDAVLALVVPTAVVRPHPGADRGPAAGAAGRGRAGPGRVGPAAAARTGGGRGPGVPAYAYPESAARALSRAARYGSWRSRPADTVPDLAGPAGGRGQGR